MNKDILKILADWLKAQNIFYSYNEHDGAIETAIKNAKQDVCMTIGHYITEILAMDDEQIKNELKDIDNGKR